MERVTEGAVSGLNDGGDKKKGRGRIMSRVSVKESRDKVVREMMWVE